MCGLFKSIGNTVKNVFKNPLPTLGTIGGELLGGPLGAGLGDAIGNVASGKSIGKSLLSGLETGAGTYAGGALADYAGGAFPETVSSFNDTLSSLNPFPETTSSISNGISGAYDDVKDYLGLGSGGSANSATGISAGQSYSSDLAGNPISPVTSPSLTANGATGGVDQFKNFVSSLDPMAPGGISPSSAAGAAAPASASSGIKGLLDKIGITPMQALTGAGLGAAALAGNKQSGAEKDLSSIAGSQSATGKKLISDAQAGILPPGMDASIEQQTNDAVTAIKSKYAQMGLSGSSSETQAINQIRQQAGQQRAAQLQEILTQGLSALGAAGGTDQSIVQNQLSQDKGLYETLIGLAGLGGGSDSGKSYKLTAA